MISNDDLIKTGTKISSNSDWVVFTNIAKVICEKFDAKVIEKLDGLDQRYWDIQIGENIFTLHLEHFLGISIYIKDLINEQNALETLSKVENIFPKEAKKENETNL